MLDTPPRLRYVTDEEPGLRRTGRTRFRYVDPEGRRVDDAETIARVTALAIPPAWTDVWISPHPNGHIQATGRDAKGRKQYRYHPRWSEHRAQVKFDQLRDFGHALPTLRARIDEDLSERGLGQDRVVALVVSLLDLTGCRVGSEVYAKQNKTYGITTLRSRHARVTSGAMHMRFTGKHGKVFEISCNDPRLARIAKRCQELPGQTLFQYLDDDGAPRPVRAEDINEYLQQATGLEITAKTFRTWEGSVQAATLLAGIEVPTSERARQSTLKDAIGEVADVLGNTVAVCRSSYVHPRVVELWEADELADRWASGPRRGKADVSTEERRFLHVLELDLPRHERRAA
ncbi:DNA topoisomerase IB [Actinomarinicola tropica]|uniref:DNA topoisomerase n=1 Tax=Actinomarinicola tropica TaxID=2789776 RepID=A0A5Q2RHG7_9ACTN|nr:DNA topoisomerase IB [Actinomarinicola tropica]QGG95024.1 DNA topoisomerase IB [Actinomarinicola tropica]